MQKQQVDLMNCMVPLYGLKSLFDLPFGSPFSLLFDTFSTRYSTVDQQLLWMPDCYLSLNCLLTFRHLHLLCADTRGTPDSRHPTSRLTTRAQIAKLVSTHKSISADLPGKLKPVEMQLLEVLLFEMLPNAVVRF